MKRFSSAALAAVSACALLIPGAALAQSNPCFNPGTGCRALQTGDVPTATQWNSFFTAKQDVLTTGSVLPAWLASGAAAATGLVPYGTHAALTAVTTPSSPNALVQWGYYAAGDGGWAWYDWNASSLLTADGVAVILPSGQSAGTAGRYIMRREGNAFRAEAFGAVYPYHSTGDATLTGNALSSASSSFTTADVGDPVIVWYAGATTTIAAPAQPTNVTPTTNTTLAPGNVVCYPRGSLGSATYFYRLTYVGSGGETTGSTEGSIACGANTLPEFTSPPSAYGAQTWNVYISTSTGTETLQNKIPMQIGQTYWLPNFRGSLPGRRCRGRTRPRSSRRS